MRQCACRSALVLIRFVARIPWNAMNLFNEPTEELAAYYLNRLSVHANLLAFSLVLALWMSIGPFSFPSFQTYL